MAQSYHFVSREEFEAMLARDEFLEWAQVFGNYYGTHRGDSREGPGGRKDLVLDIDVQGARQLKGEDPGGCHRIHPGPFARRFWSKGSAHAAKIAKK